MIRIVVGIPLSEVYTESHIFDTVAQKHGDIPFNKKVRCLDRMFCGKPLARLYYEPSRTGERVEREFASVEELAKNRMTVYFPWAIHDVSCVDIMKYGIVGLHVGKVKEDNLNVVCNSDEIQKLTEKIAKFFSVLNCYKPVRTFIQQCKP